MRRLAWVAAGLAGGAWAQGCLLLERSSVEALSGGDAGPPSDVAPRTDASRTDGSGPSDASPADSSRATLYAEAVLGDEPLAYWRLAEGPDAATAVDETGHYNGTYDGVTLGVPGAIKGDTCAEFEAGAHVSMGSPAALTLAGTPFSIELWINPAITTKKQPFLSMGDYSCYSGGYTLFNDLRPDGGDLYVDFWRNGGGHPLDVPGTPNQWTYFVFTFDRSPDGDGGMGQIYLQGSGATNPTQLPSFGAPPSGTVFTLSTLDGDPVENGAYFVGLLEDVAVYDKALDAATIAQHYAVAIGADAGTE
jgi:Concanavalin A-like lectin/glucanases superfamily